MKSTHAAGGPIRTCIVCRERASSVDLVRLAASPSGEVIVDFRGKLPGRGVWSHAACLGELVKRPLRLKKPLRLQNVIPRSWDADYRVALNRAIRDGLSMAAGAGALIGGTVMLKEALQRRSVLVVVLASDVAPRTEKQLRNEATDGVTFVRLEIDAAILGGIVGKGLRAALGVQSSRSSTHLIRQLRRLRRLG